MIGKPESPNGTMPEDWSLNLDLETSNRYLGKGTRLMGDYAQLIDRQTSHI